MVPRQREPLARLFLQAELLGAKGPDILPGFRGGEFGGGAVLVGRADQQGFAAPGALEPGKNIGRQLRPSERA